MAHHMDVDNMSEADLMVNFKVILNENTQLKLVNGVIAEKLNELPSDVVKLLKKRGITCHILVEQNDIILRQTLEELKKENLILKTENEMLRNKLNDYDKRISELEGRVETITFREAVRILEGYICLEAVGGSKTKFKRGNRNFDAISKSSDTKVTAGLAKILIVRGLSKGHLATISYLKDCGDFDSRPAMMTKEEWIVALTGEDLDEASQADEKNND